MAISNGKYSAKAVGQCVLGASAKKGTPFIELYFEIQDGENKGARVKWTSYLSDNTSERTLESLYTCGWSGDDLGEFADGGLHGLGTNLVSITVELEDFTTDAGETRASPRVRWVNPAGGTLNQACAMPEGVAAELGARMRGLAMAVKSRAKVKPPLAPGLPIFTPQSDSEDIPF